MTDNTPIVNDVSFVDVCHTCGAPIGSLQIGLSKKLINRGTKVYWCNWCLSAMSGFPETAFPGLIVRFRRQGCTLFAPWTDADETAYLAEQQK